MIHNMHLDEIPFNMINSGEKKIEYRVNDEKRQKMKIGDTIVFSKRPEEIEKIATKIVDIKYYKDLYSMYDDSFNQYLNKYYKNTQDVVDDTTYYSDEEINKYGCVSIFFKKIN